MLFYNPRTCLRIDDTHDDWHKVFGSMNPGGKISVTRKVVPLTDLAMDLNPSDLELKSTASMIKSKTTRGEK